MDQPILILTGGNDFGVPGASLRGCVNDLHSRYNFNALIYRALGWKVYSFVNNGNVASKVRECLDFIGSTVKPGQIVDIQNSSHGAKYQGEYLTCCYKFDWQNVVNTFISARQYWLAFKKIADRGGLLSFWNDACNSGDISVRALSFFEGPPRDIVVKSVECPLVDNAPDSSAFNLKAAIADSDLDIVYISGCGPKETDYSADVMGPDGQAYGGFTHAAIPAAASNRNKSFVDIHSAIIQNCIANGLDQRPEIHGLGQHRIYLPEADINIH